MKYDAAVLERVAQKFRRDMWESVVPDAVTESGVEVERFGPVQATSFGDLPEVHNLNEIQGAAEPGAIAGGHLADAVEWMRAREVDYRVPVAAGRPGTEEAEAWLGQRGYERGGGWVKFVRDVSPPDIPPDPGIQIWPLGQNEIDGEGMSAIVAEAMELPITAGTLFFSLPQRLHWHCYTASLDPEEGIVSTASMLIYEGVAQLGPGNTLPHARGQGCNTALLRRRMLDAIDAGCHTIFAEVWDCAPEQLSPAGRIFVKAGFEQAYSARNWQRPALHPAAAENFRYP
ncbi:MAG: hypothetical protein JJE35_01805 [Thermoleophilia bacterium]|nr:hypothetical protein [Thermoleophilia bacterium]